jgi:hydrogenase maturation protein HypF
VSTAGRHIEIRGVVQGVGLRPWVFRLATEHGVGGYVRNHAAGVTIEAFGSTGALDMFTQHLEQSPPPAAFIAEFKAWSIPGRRVGAFSILESNDTASRRVSIPADLATCPDCLAELINPADRRFRYPFINCTNCGPRFTITRDVPYDRSATVMASFQMCRACQREYDDASNRRFHAEPNACPACGPRLQLVADDGRPLDGDPIAVVAAALADGRVVAIKGLGGFHLACDAFSAPAVGLLRERKRRDEKPFAVMVRDLEEADELAVLRDEERQLLASVERPIVLAGRRLHSRLAAEVAPGNPLVGVMLPYTPLHHLLMRDAARPLVMTSANLSDEPLAYQNGEAVSRLRGIADLLLMHDRDIAMRCDDSVVRVIAGSPVVFRRARGYVPRGVKVTTPFDVPVLACGGMLKNTVCIGLGDTAYLGPHIGDLESLETRESFEQSIERMQQFLRVQPAIIACDLHPDARSTAHARQRPEAVTIRVQHHHAHVASAMAEHGLVGPVIGVAYDGTGYGSDGTAWGGELLVARYETFERAATLRPIRLAGGDAAIRHPWRIALALVEDAFGGSAPLAALPLLSAVPATDVTVVRQMLASRFRSPLAHGAGRYFDGIGALVLCRPRARYEGQVALEWNGAADPEEDGLYGYAIDRMRSPMQVDLRPMVRDVVGDLLNGIAASTISAKFHNTFAAATVDIVRELARDRGPMPVVLSGGCFQNARLAEAMADALRSRFDVYLHRDVPPGDGGLALGQAVVAAAIARGL